ncbi:hypothetical protein LXL04_005151 [Taraxacum kok-saghyz]
MGFYFLSFLIEITVSILIKLEVIVKALKWLQMNMDLDEVECILSILIYTNMVKGYFGHKCKVAVLSKHDPFPKHFCNIFSQRLINYWLFMHPTQSLQNSTLCIIGSVISQIPRHSFILCDRKETAIPCKYSFLSFHMYCTL